jgi:hypothetical protein
MKLFGFSFFEPQLSASNLADGGAKNPAINPATGLPMVAGEGSIDVAGNTYGMDSAHGTGLTFDDSFSGAGATWDSGGWDAGGGCGFD